MGTKITKGNVKSAIKDDKAHIDYLKRDVLDDQKGGGKYKDINQTADEKHISKLAGDIKHDHSFLSKHWNHSSPLNDLGPISTADSHNKDIEKAEGIKSLQESGEPIKFVDIAEGEVDGVAYGAADVDGHIAIDTSTVGYDDTANLP